MIIFLLTTSAFVQITILVFIVLLYQQKQAKNVIPKRISNNQSLVNINDMPSSDLIKQIIELNDYKISFRANFNGYLYVTAARATLYINNEKVCCITKHIEKYYIKKNTNISIKNIQQLKSIRFTKWSNEEFFEDINKGVFKNIDNGL